MCSSDLPYWKLFVHTEKEGLSIKAVGCKDYENEASAQAALATLRSQSQLTVETVTRKIVRGVACVGSEITIQQSKQTITAEVTHVAANE